MTEPPDSRSARRQERLRAELTDEQVPVPVKGAIGDLIVRELDHARHPPVHERHVATYRALIAERPWRP